MQRRVRLRSLPSQQCAEQYNKYQVLHFMEKVWIGSVEQEVAQELNVMSRVRKSTKDVRQQPAVLVEQCPPSLSYLCGYARVQV